MLLGKITSLFPLGDAAASAVRAAGRRRGAHAAGGAVRGRSVESAAGARGRAVWAMQPDRPLALAGESRRVAYQVPPPRLLPQLLDIARRVAVGRGFFVRRCFRITGAGGGGVREAAPAAPHMVGAPNLRAVTTRSMEHGLLCPPHTAPSTAPMEKNRRGNHLGSILKTSAISNKFGPLF
eukprot:172492-Chlamydomonas_euryale.AAC.5